MYNFPFLVFSLNNSNPTPLSSLTIFQWLNLGVLLHLGPNCQVEVLCSQTSPGCPLLPRRRPGAGRCREPSSPYQTLISFSLVMQDIVSMNLLILLLKSSLMYILYNYFTTVSNFNISLQYRSKSQIKVCFI